MRSRLFALGFLTLFLELILIRYLAGNVWNLGYFPNLVLLAAFIGMGTGFVFHPMIPDRRSPFLFAFSTLVLSILIGFVYLFHPEIPGFKRFSGEIGNELFFTSTPTESGLLSYSTFVFWFAAVIAVFFLICQLKAKLFRTLAPLTAYTLDIVGGCCGIVLFMALSWLRLPAWSWLILAMPAYVWILGRRPCSLHFIVSCALAVVAFAAWVQDRELLMNPAYDGPVEVTWSPYQKIEYMDEYKQIFVNGIRHQSIDAAAGVPGSYYSLPYRQREEHSRPPIKSVLVLGSGSGNDVSAALLNGAERVDAVEIDPVIAGIGIRHNPIRPYQDSRVSLTIDDGRAFLSRSRERYDLIVFALTDSLVKVSPVAQLRLENYLLTREAFRKAASLLTKTGEIVFYNYHRHIWLRDKIQGALIEATGRMPRVFALEPLFAVLIVGPWDNKTALPESFHTQLRVASDDWPFPYLKKQEMPEIYRWAVAGIAALIGFLMFLLRQSGPRAGGRMKLAFLFMGLPFLLLETKSVIQFSLLFGTTWINNSLVFLAILLSVLAANWTVHKWKRKPPLKTIYGLLILSSLATLAYPLSNLLSVENPELRFVLASLMVFSPVYLANLIFSFTFRDQETAEQLLGWNLLGCTLGGVIEYLSMWLGYNALAAVVAVCYTFVVILLTRPTRGMLLVRSTESESAS
ncbi:MAG: hypothetical protein V1798_00370 [Pseudomonadota bacterium]